MRKYNKMMDYIDLDDEDQKLLIEKKLKIMAKSCIFGISGYLLVMAGKHIFRVLHFIASNNVYTLSKVFAFTSMTYFAYLPQHY